MNEEQTTRQNIYIQTIIGSNNNSELNTSKYNHNRNIEIIELQNENKELRRLLNVAINQLKIKDSIINICIRINGKN